MAQFHRFEVTDVTKTIRDAVVVTLQSESGAPVDFFPGQYLTFRHDFDGTELRRSYSICAGRDEGVLKVGIKKVAGGAFSTWANESLSAGMVLEAMPPMGRFHVPFDPNARRRYLGFAAGSGITPVLSILKSALAAEAGAEFTLVYANRSVATIMFREDLEDLKNTYMGRLNIIHMLDSDAQEIDLFRGPLDEAKCAQLFSRWVNVAATDMAFICGPEPMMRAIDRALQRHGLSPERIKYELFASAQPGRLPRKTSDIGAGVAARAMTEATVTLDGARRSFTMSKDQSLLDAALDQALDAPFACKAGVCSTCRCRLLEGEVEMIANHALEDDEVAQGYRLSCQSYPVSERVAITYDV